MVDFMVEIPASVLAALTRDEWRVVCEQLDAHSSIYYSTEIGGKEVLVPIFERMLENLLQDMALEQVVF